jgi:tetratricopeptide (TPR) repeat protein
VTAYREPWTVRSRRWVRRNQGLAAGVTSLLITAVAALAIGLGAVEYEKRRAEQERDRADRNLRLAYEAVDKTVTKITGNPRLKETDFLQLRRELLEYMTPFYQEFVRQRKDDPELESQRGRAFSSLANIRSETGQIQSALSDYKQMCLDFEHLAEEYPRNPEYSQYLAMAHNGLANVFTKLGRRADAEGAYRDALKVKQRLLTSSPWTPDYTWRLARTQDDLASFLHEEGKNEEAVAVCREALKSQAQLVASYPTEPRFRSDLAHSYSNLSIMQNALGRHAEAVSACREALRIQLGAGVPKDRNDRVQLAQTHNALGALLREMGKPADAAAAFRDALKIKGQLAADFPSVPAYRRELAEGHHNLGLVLWELRQPDQAEAACREALKIEIQLVADFPKERDYRRDLAVSHSNLAALLAEIGQPQKAEEAYRASIALMKQLAVEFPNVPAYRMYLAGTSSNLSGLFMKNGRLDDADGVSRDAIPVLKELQAEFPNVPDYANQLAVAMDNRARVLAGREQFSQARELLEGAAHHHQAALKANPRNPIYRQLFIPNRGLLVCTLAALGDHSKAGKIAEQLATVDIATATDAYQAACFLAQCVSVANKDTKLPQDKRQGLADSYADRALALLRLAVSKGYKDAAHLKIDSFLVPLHSNQDFKKLLKELESCTMSDLPAIPPDELLHYFSEVAEALDSLHQQKLSPRDIKPQILLHLKGHAKLIAQTALDRTLTANMAPEMWRGKISVHSDQYSLALTWYEMRTCRRPFSAANMLELLQQHVFEKPDLSGLPSAEQKVLLRALAKKPDERFPTCVAFVQALREALTP